MLKKSIIIQFLYILTLQAAPLNFSLAKAHFLSQTQSNLKDLDLKSQLNTPQTLSLQYYFQNKLTSRSIHALDISLSNSAEKGLKMSFTNSARNNIIKNLKYYFKEEMDLQWPVFNELVSRLLIAPPLGKRDNSLFLNLLGDVRKEILESYAGRSFNVEVSFVEDIVRIELVSEESLISFFNVKIETNVAKISASEHYQENEFYMVIDMFLSQHNLEEKKELKIDMITMDKNYFDNKIKVILGHLDLANFTNNNKENVNILSSFFKTYEYVISNAVKKENHLDFQINYETQKALGRFTYLPPQNLNSLGSYQLRILKDGDEIRNFTYKRMTVSELKQMFLKNEMDKLFKSMYDEIMEMFREKYQETHSKLYPKYKLNNFNKEAGIFGGINSKGFLAKNDKGDVLVEFLYGEDSKNNIVLSFKAKDPLLELTEHFNKKMYNKQVVSKWVEYTLEHHVVMKKQDITFI